MPKADAAKIHVMGEREVSQLEKKIFREQILFTILTVKNPIQCFNINSHVISKRQDILFQVDKHKPHFSAAFFLLIIVTLPPHPHSFFPSQLKSW